MMNTEPVIIMLGTYVLAPIAILFTVGTFVLLIAYKRKVKADLKSSK
jgi:hypothetical protein